MTSPRILSLVAYLLGLALGGLATAQQQLNFALAESFDQFSPETSGGAPITNATSVHVMDSAVLGTYMGINMIPGGPQTLFNLDHLNLVNPAVPGFVPEIMSFSTAQDEFPAAGLVDLNAITGVHITIEYTVDRLWYGGIAAPPSNPAVTQGFPVNQGLIAYEATSGNGAASDVYHIVFDQGVRSKLFQSSDASGITPRSSPGAPYSETNISSLDPTIRRMPEAYFTVNTATADALTIHPGNTSALTFHPSDILKMAPGQFPTIHIPHTTMGLHPGDEIDALAIDHGRLMEPVISLSRLSPSITSQLFSDPDVFASAVGGLLVLGTGIPQLSIWTPPWVIGIPAMDPAAPDPIITGGDLNGLSIYDPRVSSTIAQAGNTHEEIPGSNMAPGTVGPLLGPTQPLSSEFSALTIDQSDGGRDRRLIAEPGRSPLVEVKGPNDGAFEFALWIQADRIDTTPTTMLLGSPLVVLPPWEDPALTLIVTSSYDLRVPFPNVNYLIEPPAGTGVVPAEGDLTVTPFSYSLPYLPVTQRTVFSFQALIWDPWDGTPPNAWITRFGATWKYSNYIELIFLP